MFERFLGRVDMDGVRVVDTHQKLWPDWTNSSQYF